jgi:hypothetical protein
MNTSDIFSLEVYFYNPFSKTTIHQSVQFCTEVSEEYFITDIDNIYIYPDIASWILSTTEFIDGGNNAVYKAWFGRHQNNRLG